MESPLILVHCEGRLANQLLAWANGRFVIKDIENRTLLMNYPPLAGGKCLMPRTIHLEDVHPAERWKISEWTRVPTSGLPHCATENCVWTQAWNNHPKSTILIAYLKEIQFSPDLVWRAGNLIAAQQVIGVHIRYGDYVSIDEDNPPLVRPPFIRASHRYYETALAHCLAVFPGSKVFLATDAKDDEVAWFTERYKPLRHPPNDGVLDLITLSRCQAIVGSASTFSPVAAALGDKPCIHPETNPAHIAQIINP